MTSHPPKSDIGFVYVATGAKYVAEAAASAATLRRHHPGHPICLITDVARGPVFWDDLVVIAQPAFGFRDKLHMQLAPYARCVFLDADTTVCGDISPVFTILERYDVCGVQLSEGQDYVMEGGIPHAFPEMNGGIVGFRKTAATQGFFALWAKFYDEFRALNRDGHYHYANVGDQKSLRAALWHSSARHACIGGEFNFIPFRLELASLPVAVIHTRATANLDALARRLNARLGRRCYVPTLDAVVTDAMEGAELRRLLCATLKLTLAALGRRILPRRARGWLGASSGLRRWFFGNRHSPEGVQDHSKWEAPSEKA